LVLAIAAAIVIGSIGTTRDAQAISAARVVGSDVEVARNLAVTTQLPHTVLFSPDLQSYKVVANYAGGSYAAATAVEHPVRGNERFEVRLAGLSGMGSVVVETVSFGGEAYVTFDAGGEPSSGGSVALRSGRTGMVVSVEGLTGAVSVARSVE